MRVHRFGIATAALLTALLALPAAAMEMEHHSPLSGAHSDEIKKAQERFLLKWAKIESKRLGHLQEMADAMVTACGLDTDIAKYKELLEKTTNENEKVDYKIALVELQKLRAEKLKDHATLEEKVAYRNVTVELIKKAALAFDLDELLKLAQSLKTDSTLVGKENEAVTMKLQAMWNKQDTISKQVGHQLSQWESCYRKRISPDAFDQVIAQLMALKDGGSSKYWPMVEIDLSKP
jgi:hypothetical protein